MHASCSSEGSCWFVICVQQILIFSSKSMSAGMLSGTCVAYCRHFLGGERCSGQEKVEVPEMPEGRIQQLTYSPYGRTNMLPHEICLCLTVLSWDKQVVDEQQGPTTKREYDIATVPVGDGLIGRVVDFLGRPPGSAGQLGTTAFAPLFGEQPNMESREQINEALVTGVKVPEWAFVYL